MRGVYYFWKWNGTTNCINLIPQKVTGKEQQKPIQTTAELRDIAQIYAILFSQSVIEAHNMPLYNFVFYFLVLCI